MRLQLGDLQLSESSEAGSALTLVFGRASQEKAVVEQTEAAATSAV
jgi:hypothetical protein